MTSANTIQASSPVGAPTQPVPSTVSDAFQLALQLDATHRAAIAGKGIHSADAVEETPKRSHPVRNFVLKTLGTATLGFAGIFVAGGLGAHGILLMATGAATALVIPVTSIVRSMNPPAPPTRPALPTVDTKKFDGVKEAFAQATASPDPLLRATARLSAYFAAKEGKAAQAYTEAGQARHLMQLFSETDAGDRAVQNSAEHVLELTGQVVRLEKAGTMTKAQKAALDTALAAFSATDQAQLAPIVQSVLANVRLVK